MTDKEKDVIQNYKENTYYLAKDLLGYKDLTPTFHYKYICKKLQEPREKKIRLWLIPRGFFKTTILTISHSVQLQLNNPSIRILIVSGVLANSVSMVQTIGNVYLTNIRFRTLFPKYCPEKPKAPDTIWRGNEIHIPNRGGRPVMEGTFEAFGPESTITARHFDYIKIDDLVTRENSMTRDQMDKIKNFYKAIFPLRDNPDTPIDIIGTRWDDYDLYGELEEDEEIEVIKVPCIINGKSTFPERYPIDELKKLKRSKNMGSYLFSCLMMLDPIPQEDAVFKEKYFKYFKLDMTNKIITRLDDGEKIPVGLTFMTADGATTEGKNDYSAIIVVTTDSENNIYILDAWHKQCDPVEFMNKFIFLYFNWNCMKLGLQSAIVEKMLRSFLKEKMKREKFWINIVELKENTRQNKEYCIKSLQPWYENGCIYHKESLRGSELEEELLRFPKSKHDDVIDALQMQKEIILPSSKVSAPEVYDRNSIYNWKRRLKKIFDNEKWHIGNSNDDNNYNINVERI